MASLEIDDVARGAFAHDSFARHLDLYAHGSEPVVIDDADLVFKGDYSRSGNDLVISKVFESVTIHNYFQLAERPALHAPGGAALSGAVVSAITHSQDGERYADESGAVGPPKAIGRVEVVTGTATAVRNGQSVTLHAGDLVYQGDAVQTGENSTLALTFLDGTAFSLSSDARMVLNEMIYDPASSSNASLLTLVQGSISFVAGNVAHTGEMKVDTPVATMGIRGTAVHCAIDADSGETHFSVMREPNGRVGKFVLYDHHDHTKILSRVEDVTVIVTLSLINGEAHIHTDAKTDLDFGQELNFTQFVFQIFQIGQQNPLRAQLGLEPPQIPNPQEPHGPQGPQGMGHQGAAGGAGGGSPPLEPTPTTPQTLPLGGAPGATTPEVTPTSTPQGILLGVVTTAATTTTTTTTTTVVTPTFVVPSNVIEITAPVTGGTLGAGAGVDTINLLAGAVLANPQAHLALATNSSGQPAVSVSVDSGAYNPSSVAYTVDSAGNLQIDPSQFSSVAPGTTVTLSFHYTLVASTGAQAAQTASVTIDGGTAVTYPSTATVVVGHEPVTITPTLVSPEGGNTFAIDPPDVLLVTQVGLYGTATINTLTGTITYTPTAGPGIAGTDTFTVSDTDKDGVTTKTSVSFFVDGGTAASYAPVSVGTHAVTEAPTLVSPEGGDQFALMGSSGPVLSEVGAHGTASIDPTTGAITYTPSVSPGTGSGDTFTMLDTDALKVTTTTVFVVTGLPVISAPTTATVAQGHATAIDGVSLAEDRKSVV